MADVAAMGASLQVGCADILGRIVEDLKDESEPYRRMVMETIDKVVRDLGTADVDARLEELLIDGILYAFQEQVRRAQQPSRTNGITKGVLTSMPQVQQSRGLSWPVMHQDLHTSSACAVGFAARTWTCLLALGA